jgi:hypothetical protein
MSVCYKKDKRSRIKADLVVLHCDLREGKKGSLNECKYKAMHVYDSPRPKPPACAPPRELLPASRARVCSSLTTSSSASGTRRYFIYLQNKVKQSELCPLTE